MCRNRAQHSNTRPKLLEVSSGRTPRHNEGPRAMTVEHEINDKHVFVTTFAWTVARLSAVRVSLNRPLLVTSTLETEGN